jgi:hypothetical protein
MLLLVVAALAWMAERPLAVLLRRLMRSMG